MVAADNARKAEIARRFIKPSQCQPTWLAPGRHSQGNCLTQMIHGDVSREHRKKAGIGLQAHHSSAASDLVRRQQREVSPVSSDIHKAHSWLQDVLHQDRFLWLVASREADFSGNRIAQITSE